MYICTILYIHECIDIYRYIYPPLATSHLISRAASIYLSLHMYTIYLSILCIYLLSIFYLLSISVICISHLSIFLVFICLSNWKLNSISIWILRPFNFSPCFSFSVDHFWLCLASLFCFALFLDIECWPFGWPFWLALWLGPNTAAAAAAAVANYLTPWLCFRIFVSLVSFVSFYCICISCSLCNIFIFMIHTNTHTHTHLNRGEIEALLLLCRTCFGGPFLVLAHKVQGEGI